MIRKQLLSLAFVLLCSGAHASDIKDTGRIALGAGIGAAGIALVQVTLNAAEAFVENDSTLFPGAIDNKLIRFFALIGGTYGLLNTTYARTLRAQWNVWWSRSNKDIISLVADNYGTDAQVLITKLERHFMADSYPLVAAKRKLSMIFADASTAIQLIEAALEDIDQDSLRAEELNDWLDEVYATREFIAHALEVIDKDPRIMSLMDAQNRIDQTNALWANALAHTAVAATNNCNNNK